jgi:hypothetical protein
MDALLSELRDVLIALTHPERVLTPAPEPEPEPEPTYDTRAIERAFGLAGSSDASSGRPALTESEMAEIADEVGLALRDPNSAPTPPARTEVHAPTPIGERTDFGLPSTILAERELSALPNLDTQRRIVRELERNLGGTGIVEQFEAGLTWANKEAEASIDRQPGGARMVLRRSFAKLARKRRRRGMVFGFFGGSIAGGIAADLLPMFLLALEPVFAIGGMALGVLVGLQIAKRIHARQMDEERALLHWVGERVEALVAAERAPAALPPGPR